MKQIQIKLNSNSIKKAIKELTEYRESLAQKNELFVTKLLELGIEVAQEKVGKFGKYISFSKEVDGTLYCVGYLIAKDSEKIISQWETKDGIREVEVSSLLMAEFGSGKNAKVLFDIDGVGQGTFPGQTHAFSPPWHWKGLDGKWYSSSGVTPTHPMYHADMEMIEDVKRIAKEVFGNGI
jgi:hypothetical protein